MDDILAISACRGSSRICFDSLYSQSADQPGLTFVKEPLDYSCAECWRLAFLFFN